MRLKTDVLDIGTFITEKLNDILPTYPIIADKGAVYPFCVYRRTGFTPNNTKDIYNYEEVVMVEITCLSTSYKDSVKLAEKIKDRLERYRGVWRNTTISDIELVNATEDWSNDSYYQVLSFNFHIDNSI